MINASELRYINIVYSNMTDECNKSLNALIEVTTDGKLEMNDDERIKRIDRIYDDMTDKYAFTQSFTSQAGELAGQRNHDAIDNEFLKALE